MITHPMLKKKQDMKEKQVTEREIAMSKEEIKKDNE